jgi:hypothetical protein
MGSSNFKEAIDSLDSNTLQELVEDIGCESYLGLIEFRKLVVHYNQITFPSQIHDSKGLETISDKLFQLVDVDGMNMVIVNQSLLESLSEIANKNELLFTLFPQVYILSLLYQS